jgi:thiol-disulfide isomerase/thioredoxin
MSQQPTTTTSFFKIALLVFVGILLVRFVWPAKGPDVGMKLPELAVAGWFNGPGPTPADLAGKIVAIDCWATWCGYCIQAFPDLVTLHEKYAPRGVVLIGLTSETADDGPKISAVLDAHPDVAWPIGYGAGEVLGRFGVRALPTYILFDRTGTAVWAGHSHAELAHRVDRLLASGDEA